MAEITTSEGRLKLVRESVENPRLLTSLMKVLPKGMTAERLARQTFTLVRKNPGLLECDPLSIVAGMVQSAELGLELAGPLGHAYLVPRWNGKRKCKEAVFQIGYKGYIDLAYRSGKVVQYHLRTVGKGDTFDYCYGSNPFIAHKPLEGESEIDLTDPTTPVTHYYSCVKLLGGGTDMEVMTLAAVQRHRARYSPAPQGKPDYSAWATAPHAMGMKTVAAKMGRRLPLSVEVREAVLIESGDHSQGALQFTVRTTHLLEDLGGAAPLLEEYPAGQAAPAGDS